MSAPPLAFPTGRTLAAWWRQLAPFPIHSLWVAHLFIHRVEVLTRTERPFRPDRHALHLLDRLGTTPQTLEALEGQLRLPRQYLAQALSALAANGLLERGEGATWVPTPAAHEAQHRGTCTCPVFERQTFAFVARTGRVPQFVPLRRPAGDLATTPPARRFDLAVLAACVKKDAAWKEQRSFPREVLSIVAPDDPPIAGVPEWRKVAMDSPLYLGAVLALTNEEDGEHLHAFAFGSETGILDASQPVFSLGGDWRDVFPELAAPIPSAAWQSAWDDWCRSRNPLLGTVEPCRFETDGHRLRVHTTPALAEQARPPRGETWLLAGEGDIRRAACVEAIAER